MQTTPPPVSDSVKPWPDGGTNEVGEAGLLRLFTPQMAGQVSWLLPLALIALVSGIVRTSWKLPLSREALFYSMWAGWLLPALLFFSFGGLIHRYYLDMLAPPVAALSAVGLVTWTNDFLARKRAGWLLPVTIFITFALAVFFLGYYPEAGWLLIPLIILGLLTLACFVFPSFSNKLPLPARTSIALLTLLLVPFFWSLTPILYGGDVILPYAGPNLVYWGGQRDAISKYEGVASFLEAQRQKETFLVATQNTVAASPIQLLTRKPVMAMGGFTGADPILDAETLSKYVSDGQVRFFLLEHHDDYDSEYIEWIITHCTLLPDADIPSNMDLYDCR